MAKMAIPRGEAEYGIVTYALSLIFAIGLVLEVVTGPFADALLGGHDEIGVAVGFHDGDIVGLGVLTTGGLETATLGWTG